MKDCFHLIVQSFVSHVSLNIAIERIEFYKAIKTCLTYRRMRTFLLNIANAKHFNTQQKIRLFDFWASVIKRQTRKTGGKATMPSLRVKQISKELHLN